MSGLERAIVLDERGDLAVERVGRDDAVDEAPLERGGGVDRAAGEQHVERALAADRARQRDHRRGAEQPDLDAGGGEAGAARRRPRGRRRRRAGSRRPSRCRRTLAITGCGTRWIVSISSRAARRRAAGRTAGRDRSSRSRSWPAENAGPVASRTIARTPCSPPRRRERGDQLLHQLEAQRVALVGAVQGDARGRPVLADEHRGAAGERAHGARRYAACARPASGGSVAAPPRRPPHGKPDQRLHHAGVLALAGARRRQPHRARPHLVPALAARRSIPSASRSSHGERRRTYAELRERVNRLASALRRHGLERHDRVAALCPNVPALLELHHAVPAAGGVLVAINTRLSPQRDRATSSSTPGARLLFVDAELDPLVGRPPDGRRGRARSGSDGAYERLRRRTATRRACPRCCATRRSRSRSTTRRARPGGPKGVVYTYRGAYLNALGEVIEAELGHHPVYLWTLPMFHCNGWCFPWAVTAAGGHARLPAPVDPEDDLAAVPRGGRHALQRLARPCRSRSSTTRTPAPLRARA